MDQRAKKAQGMKLGREPQVIHLFETLHAYLFYIEKSKDFHTTHRSFVRSVGSPFVRGNGFATPRMVEFGLSIYGKLMLSLQKQGVDIYVKKS